VINDQLQDSVATYLRCGGAVNNQINKGLLLSLSVNFFKQEGGCLVHCVRLAITLLKNEESARDNHVLAGIFAKYSPILLFFH